MTVTNAKETGRIKRQVIRDCLTGSNGRAKVEGWVPRWLRFPASGYTGRRGVASATRTASAVEAMALSSDTTDEPQVDPTPMPQAA